MRSFDKQGNFTEMKADLDTNGVFTIHGEGIRSHSTLSTEDDRQILKVIWEKQDAKSKWMPWLDMRLRK